MTKAQLKQLEVKKNKLLKKNKKKPNVYKEIEAYLFDNIPLSDEALSSKGTFRTAVSYLFESFMKMPLISIYLDKHLNQKKEGLLSHEPYKILEFYKKIVRENGINRYQLYKFFPNREFQNSITAIVQKKQYTVAEAKDFYINRKIKNPLELKSLVNSKSSKDLNDITVINKAIENSQNSQNSSNTIIKENKDSLFLKELNIDIVKEKKLALFDISVLKSSNEFLYTFIDANNKKRYYKTPFQAEFYINMKTGVLNNDFIESKNKNFQKYIITNISELTSLKYTLSKIYRQFMKDI